MTRTEKAENHDRTFKESRPVVFCVRCGSTVVDQNSLTELRCYSCDNRLPWDATSFSIRRYEDDADDVVSAFELAEKHGKP